jgi:DNA-binding transcriptional ArsR family regulator
MNMIFEALASATRRRILLYLAEDDLTAGAIAARFDMSKPAISKHLQLLESAGLVGSRKRGQYVHYWLVRGTLVDALEDFVRRVVAPSVSPSPPAPPPPPPLREAPAEAGAANALFVEQLQRARDAYAADMAQRFG